VSWKLLLLKTWKGNSRTGGTLDIVQQRWRSYATSVLH